MTRNFFTLTQHSVSEMPRPHKDIKAPTEGMTKAWRVQGQGGWQGQDLIGKKFDKTMEQKMFQVYC